MVPKKWIQLLSQAGTFKGVFLVGAFLEKKVDYGHGFSSVFFCQYR